MFAKIALFDTILEVVHVRQGRREVPFNAALATLPRAGFSEATNVTRHLPCRERSRASTVALFILPFFRKMFIRMVFSQLRPRRGLRTLPFRTPRMSWTTKDIAGC
jgi:hypothetical protein